MSKKYSKKTPREHVLLRPDTYVGDIEPTTEMMWVKSTKDEYLEKKEINYVPGFYKIFDEILVNARDACINDKSSDTIDVEINQEEGFISVLNNGNIGIPIEEHKIHKSLIPSMIFGEMLTSSNFDDEEKRTTGGRNGYGAKLTNIFSTKFEVTIVNKKSKKKFSQVWTDNMGKIGKPKVQTLTAKTIKPYVKIVFYPDFEKFKIKNIDDDHYNLFYKRTMDVAAITCNKIKITFNKEKIKVNDFRKYMDLYYPTLTDKLYDSNDRWEIGCIYNPNNGGEVISYVNGISTYRGGTHVNHVIDNIIKRLINNYIKKKHKDIKIKTSFIKENLIFFVNAVIENPSFISQTKEALTTKVNKFGSTFKATDVFMKKLSKCGIVDQVINLALFKENNSLKKTDGKKKTTLRGIPKLEDANKAGGKYSQKCSLILTEGDSAKAFAMSGLSIVGRDYFGVFPLKGKMLNVREASNKQMSSNSEINYLKQIMGLKKDHDYSVENNFNSLRYGRIICLTDQDTDGSHIKGLLINCFHYLWPSLLKHKGFISSLATPIVKSFKGKKENTFYNLTDYEKWKENNDGGKGWKVKYYKGLGTSTSKEAKEYFIDIEDKLIQYYWEEVKTSTIVIDDDGEKTVEKVSTIKSNKVNNMAVSLAFDKKRADDRKKWLMAYDRNNIITYAEKEISLPDFINKDLIHFSNDDTLRSIPSLVDGLKPSQRKVLYGSFLRKLEKDEVKVSQLAGFVSDKSAYHHGEASLMGCIIGMAQNYVGSNNINILKPNGQFGTRLRGGKDAASARYIWTKLEDMTRLIFKPEDEVILNYLDDDGQKIEPEWYLPIIPMVLINGADGIGTGFSTTIPPYNPICIINCLINKIENKKSKRLKPWWGRFDGKVRKIDSTTYQMQGIWEKNNNSLIITELPVGEWTTNYKEFLDKKLEKKTKDFLGYKDNNTDKKVNFTLNFSPGTLDDIDDKFIKAFKLRKVIHTTNMHLYSAKGQITKFKKAEDIIDQYYQVRLDNYYIRKTFQLKQLKNELDIIKYKVKFIRFIFAGKIIINNKPKIHIMKQLETLKFPQLTLNKNDTPSFNYLLNMPIYSLTKEKIEELEKQQNIKTVQYDKLESTAPKQIWKNELNELLENYEKWWEQQLRLDDAFTNIKKTKIKIKSKKSKKKNKKTKTKTKSKI